MSYLSVSISILLSFQFTGLNGNEQPATVACKRSTVSSTASSDAELPPAMEQCEAVVRDGVAADGH